MAGTAGRVSAGRRRGWRRLGRSLGARLVGVFLMLALLVTVIFLIGMQQAFRGGWQDYARPLVSDYTDRIVAEIGTPPDVARAEALARRLPLRIRIEGPVVNWTSEAGDEARDARSRRPGPVGEFGRELRREMRNDIRGDMRHARAADDGTHWRPVRLLADGHRISLGLADTSREDRPRAVGWATLAALLLLTVAAYGTVRRLLRPLSDIRSGAIRYGQGDFSRPIAARRDDELGELAGQINTMAQALQQRLDDKRALLLAISHELRSPLTRARVNAELLADEADAAAPPGPREALLRDLAEMRDLISDLLESERLAGGHAALQTEPTDLNALVAEVVAQQFAGRPIHLMLAPALPLVALDRVRVRLLVRNLLDNALRHGATAGTAPEVHTQIDHNGFTLTVRDHGPGVPEAHLPLLAEAFYRPDAARQRATGGVGLGLYLCRLVAEAHGGRLTLRNARPGLEVQVTLAGRQERLASTN